MKHRVALADDVIAKLSGRRLLVLLDYDGTLSETTADPGTALLSARRRRILDRLRQGRGLMAVISGRSVRDLKKVVGMKRKIIYCGNFGLEIQGGGWRFVHPRARTFRKKLALVSRQLSGALRGVPGAELEDKRWGLAVHYRNVPPENILQLKRRLSRVRAGCAAARLLWTQGDRACEIRPDIRWNKGDAAKLLWRLTGRLTILAVGDGAQDEAMFLAARDRGAAVKVGHARGSLAPYWLESVEQVYLFLDRLARSNRRPRRNN